MKRIARVLAAAALVGAAACAPDAVAGPAPSRAHAPAPPRADNAPPPVGVDTLRSTRWGGLIGSGG